jgi:2,3-bisphosphoglycerate-independent phosphoglycerate mutase
MKLRKRPFLLLIRDGWGHNPNPAMHDTNAIELARTPVEDWLMAAYPHTLVASSGEDVGLPEGTMGNSEVGHQNIGAGRIVDQEVLRITKDIREGRFFANSTLVAAFDHASKTGGKVHITGLCSDIGVHSVLPHMYALLEMARKRNFPGDRVFLHFVGDGRDSPPDSGLGYCRDIEARMKQIGVGRIASVIGRFYAMDRDNRWDRVERAYRLMVYGEGRKSSSAAEAIQHYYDHPTNASQVGDEFIEPTVIVDNDCEPLALVADGDTIIHFNFRGDRPREITKAFLFDPFPYEAMDKGQKKVMGFARDRKINNLYYASMTEWEKGLPVHVIFGKPPPMKNIAGELWSVLGLKQLRCAETEKYAHVTFFFNDGREEPFAGEERILIDSPKVSTYDLKPEMSAPGVCQAALKAIESDKYDVIVVNFANGDMVGHTGNLQAAIQAIEAVDACDGQLVKAILAKGGLAIVCADHGNSEQMWDPTTDGPFTAHTTYPTPLIVVDDDCKGATLRSDGRLADIVPTALRLQGIEQPKEMTGRSLIT